MGCRRDQRNQIQPCLFTGNVKFFFFLKGNVRKDQTVQTGLCRAFGKTLCAIGKHHIRIGHKDEGNPGFFPDSFHHLKNPVSRHAAGKRPDVCRLDHRSLCRRIRKGDPQFDDRSAGLLHCVHQLFCRLQIRIPAGDKRDKCFFFLKCLLYSTHRYPPLCILQSRHSLCHLCRKY